MKSPPFGCLSTTGIAAALLTLLLIGGFGLVQGGALFSPGDLSAQASGSPLSSVLSHADLESECRACHAPPWISETMSDRCLLCHTDIRIELEVAHSLHRQLLGEEAMPCQSCHTEHEGPEARLTVLDDLDFPHAVTGFSLQGHANMIADGDLLCSDCHEEDFSTFDLVVCGSCHQSLDEMYISDHVTAFGENCISCHDGIDTYGSSFDHNELAFSLPGAHAVLDCNACHQGARSIVDFQAVARECVACHVDDNPHENLVDDQCELCHSTSNWGDVNFDHSGTTFALVGQHASVECIDCHQDNVFMGTPQNCFDCHELDDVHQRQLGQNCAICHTTEGWDKVTFDHFLSEFPLLGQHAEVACERCHQDQIFAGTPRGCVDCHASDDAHQSRFGPECGACHTPEGWETATFDHSLSLFPLTGAHLSLECSACHQGGVFEATPKECVRCHAEPEFHLNLFGVDCAACHTTDAWTPAAFDDSHTFPIDHGENGYSSCRTCHPSVLNAYTCYECHEHSPGEIEAEHREEGISNFNDCVECHPTGREEEGERSNGRGGREDGDDD